MFPEVYVNLRYEISDVNKPAFVGEDLLVYNMNMFSPTKLAILEIHGEYEAEVRCTFGRYADNNLVVSCLFAALKNIGDNSFYNEVRMKLINQLNVTINDNISESIGHIEETISKHDDAKKYFIEIEETIGKYPVDVRFSTSDGGFVFVEIRYNGTVYVCKENIPEYGTVDEHKSMTVDAVCRAFLNFYYSYPELSYTWAQVEEKFHVEIGKMIAQDFKFGIGNSFIAHSEWGFKSQFQTPASKKDERVEKLPGINEIVTHPVDGRQMPLNRAIIHLNDVAGWTREQIADWLETLDIDLRFKNEQD